MRRTTFVVFSFTVLAFLQSPQLALKPGVFVREPYSCKDAPNAGIRVWDGVGFSGAASRKCTTRVMSHRGERFRISTTCSALGNGTPDTSGYAEELSLIRGSETRFAVEKQGQPEGTYPWCSGKPGETGAILVKPEFNGFTYDSTYKNCQAISFTDRGDNNTFRMRL
jgi:hypothetical protein